MKNYLVVAKAGGVSGTQTFRVLAEDEADAEERLNAGEGERVRCKLAITTYKNQVIHVEEEQK